MSRIGERRWRWQLLRMSWRLAELEMGRKLVCIEYNGNESLGGGADESLRVGSIAGGTFISRQGIVVCFFKYQMCRMGWL